MPRLPKSSAFLLVACSTLWVALSGCSQAPYVQSASGLNKDKRSPANKDTMMVYKNILCFCCNKWMQHLEQNAFQVKSDNTLDMAEVKQQWGVSHSMQGCHTGVFNDQYVFEGHVPARLVRKFLSNPPQHSIGLAVPGMPAGSPGMYKEDNKKEFEAYTVYLIQPNGQYKFYETVKQPEQLPVTTQ